MGLVTWAPPAPGELPGRAGHSACLQRAGDQAESDSRGRSQGAFSDPQWVLQGTLEEESAVSVVPSEGERSERMCRPCSWG